MLNRNLILCLVVLPVLFLFGCMVGDDYSRPATFSYDGTGFANDPFPEDPNDVYDAIGIGPWWADFGDEITVKLVRQAIENNYDMKAAAARVLEAQAQLEAVHGAQLPDVSYGASRNRSKMSFNSPFGGRQSFLSTTYAQNIQISYMVDFFGKLKRAEQASMADLLAVEANQQALRHTIISQVVRTRVNIATQKKLLGITTRDIKSREETVAIVERRYSAGLVSALDVYLAKENLAGVRASEFVIRQLLENSLHTLDVLLGQRPATTTDLDGVLPEYVDLQPIPAGLPAGLLDRRPDVRASEMKLKASNERVGVSIAQLYPDFTLTGSAGYRSDSFSELFDEQGQVYSLIMSLSAPIWKGGQLRAQVKAAKARYEQDAANYSSVILNAFKDVEDALVKEQLLKKRLVELKESYTQADLAQKLARKRYQQGLETILIVLDTERRSRLAENAFTLANAELYNARIDLFLALGGDWHERDKEIEDETETK